MNTRRIIVVLVFILLTASGCNRETSTQRQRMNGDNIESIQNTEETETEEMEDIEEIAESYRDIYEEGIQNKTLGSLDVIRKIVKRIGDAGYAVVDNNNKIDMVNAGQVEMFCKQVEEKKKAEATIITIMESGDFIWYDLHTNNGKVNITRSSVFWKNGTPESNKNSDYMAHTWVYSPKGYLFFEEYHPLGFDGPSGHTAIRVKPLDEKCREMNRTYMEPFGYYLNKLFITDWSEKDYGSVDFYDIYEITNQRENNVYVPYEDTYEGVSYEIPRAEFEGIIGKYFSITSEELQKRTVFHQENDTYRYRPRGLYDCALTPYIPYPEVVAYEEKEDGTIELTVDAVWPEENLERAFSHKVVVRPRSDNGFQYVSNYVIPSEHNVAPSWYTNRLNDEEWSLIMKER